MPRSSTTRVGAELARSPPRERERESDQYIERICFFAIAYPYFFREGGSFSICPYFFETTPSLVNERHMIMMRFVSFLFSVVLPVIRARFFLCSYDIWKANRAKPFINH